MKKIVITGPESSGKSTLARALALHYKARYTEEQARAYLEQLVRSYDFDDLFKIAQLQVEVEDYNASLAGDMLFCDTDLITIKIWSDHKYRKVDSQILKWINHREYDLYLVCKPDIPWEPDPLRENPHDRDFLFDKHLDELIHYHKSFEVIEGDGNQRLLNAIQIIDKYRRFWEDH